MACAATAWAQPGAAAPPLCPTFRPGDQRSGSSIPPPCPEEEEDPPGQGRGARLGGMKVKNLWGRSSDGILGVLFVWVSEKVLEVSLPHPWNIQGRVGLSPGQREAPCSWHGLEGDEMRFQVPSGLFWDSLVAAPLPRTRRARHQIPSRSRGAEAPPPGECRGHGGTGDPGR